MVGVSERMGVWLRQHTYTTSRRIDDYLSENLPELIEANSLATRSEIIDINRTFDRYEIETDRLEEWEALTSSRIRELEEGLRQVELKRGIASKAPTSTGTSDDGEVV